MSAAVLVAAALRLAAGPNGDSVPAHRVAPNGTKPAVAATLHATQMAPSDEVPRVDAVDVERALSTTEPGTRDLVLQRLLAPWIARDPAAAARFAELRSEPFLREVALRTVAQSWATRDANAAGAWATSLGDEIERNRAIEDVALASSDSDPVASLDLLARRTIDTRHDNARVGVITSWARRDFESARQWVESQPPGPSRDDIVQHLVFLLAHDDPLAAALLAKHLLGDDAARREAYASIIRPWIERDPAAVDAWLEGADELTRRRIDAELAAR